MRLRTGIVALAAAGLTLTACTGGGDEEVSSGIASPSADATGTLTVWLMKGSQPNSVVDAVNAQFAELYPDVDVQVELQQWAGIQDKLRTALDTSATPDVVEIGNSLTARFADAGQLADLTSQAQSFGVDDMLPGLQPSGVLDGSRFGIPYYGGVDVVVYRKSDFKRAGITAPPTSLDELGEAAKKLQSASKGAKDYSAFYFPGTYWQGAMPFVWAHGGEIATQDEDGSWTGTLDSAQSVEGLTQLADLVEKYSKAPTDGDDMGNVNAFQAGEVGMMIDSWWVPGALDNGELKGDVGAFELPGVKSGTTAPVYFGGSDLAVSAKSANPGLAVEWMKILTGLQAQTQLAKEGGVIPNQEGAFAGHAGNPFLAVADRAATNSRFTPVSPNWANVETSRVLQDMLVRIFSGEATVEESTAQASQSLTSILNG